MATRSCAYCGFSEATTFDHVFSRGLYGDHVISQTQLLTVPACQTCNNGFSDDEALFRNVITIAGEPNFAVNDLWTGKIQRGFSQVDGRKRAGQLASLMQPAEGLPNRYLIFPAQIPAVLRIVRKIVRGLCHHHRLLTAVRDEQVLADILRFQIPDEFSHDMHLHCVHPQVARYQYTLIGEFGIHSAWLIEFFNRTPFVCIVYDTIGTRRAAEAYVNTATEQGEVGDANDSSGSPDVLF